MTEKERDTWVVLGRAIGTATGWDYIDIFQILLYQFTPADTVRLPSGDVMFNFETGKAILYDSEGGVIESVDIISTIAHLPITEPLVYKE